MEINVTMSRAMMDDVMKRCAVLVAPLPPFLLALASEFLVGSEDDATEDLKQRLEVIAIEHIALSTNTKPEASRNLRTKSASTITIPLKEYI